MTKRSKTYTYGSHSQPAGLTKMARNTMSAFMSFLVAAQPIMAQTANIVADGGDTVVYEAGNGVTTVDIATPNAAGLSQNTYEQFNVGPGGAILNNSDQSLAQSQLGGLLQGNGNLATSGPATVILNEVSGTTRSVLEGALEVHGAPADVIVANPNGITCDGCGFINTPRVTLATGLAEIGATGALSGFAVTGGDVLIGSNGADARATTIFDIVSRRISLQGPVAASGELSLTAGQNDFDYGSRTATSRGSDGNAPAIAIDSALLGGMYAGRISILATEAGSGVNMQGQMAANAGEMTLTADGRLVMGQVQASGPLRATSQSSTVRAERTIFSDEAVTLQGLTSVEIAANTLVASQSDVTLIGNDISLETGAIVAAGVTSSGVQTTSGTLSLTGTAIDAGEGTLVAGARIALDAVTVDLSRETAATGDTVRSLGDVDITTGTLTATNGQIRAGDALTVSNAGNVSITGGDFASVGGLDVTADSVSANATLNTQGTANLSATVRAVVNDGRVAGDTGVNVTAQTSITNTGDVLSQTQASLTAGTTITSAGSGQVVSAVTQLNANAVNNAGLIASQSGALAITADQSVTNTGTLVGVTALDLTSDGPVTNSGDMVAQGTVTVTGLNGGASGVITNQVDGLINGWSAVSLNGASLDNAGAIGAASGALSVDAAGDITNTGLLYSGTSSTYRLDGNFTNTNADVLAETDIAIAGLTGPRAGSVNNASGTIEAVAGNLTITAAEITNERPAPTITTSSTSVVTGSNNPPNPGRGDTTSATQTTTTTTVEEAVHNSAPAQMLAGSSITLDATTVTNDYSQIAANGNVTILAGTVTNTGRDLIETTDVRATTYYEQRYCDTRILGFCIDWDTRRWNTTQTSQTTATVDAEFATIEAGGALTALISGYLDNDAVRDGADQIGLTSGDRALAAADVAAMGGDTLSDLTLSIDTVLDRGALFDPASDPNAPYLIETRSEFIDVSQYLGSDYFLSQVGGFNPDQTMRRFGDAYVETRLIREQIFALTGGRYLAGSLDDLAQMKALYDNAIDAQQALNLTVGVALTPSQIAALTSDIAWLETQIVQGQEVLVPRLYLSQATLANVDLNSARIAGGQTTILAGAIANSGAIASATNLDLTTTTAFSNEGGSLFANADITIDVGSLFANQSGQVVGGGNVAIEAENVLNNTLISRDDMPSGFTDRAQQTARIEAGGNLQINASGVVGAIGGDFASGDNMTITAGDGIEIGALVLETNREDAINGGYDNAYSRTNTLANLAAGGDLNIATGGDLTIEGGNLNAGGDATLIADGSVDITSVQDVDQRDLKLDIDSGGLFGVETNIRRQEAEVETQRTVISSGGGLTITANTDDLSIAASTLESGDETRLTAGGEVRLLTETDSTFSQDFLREEDLFWWNEGDEGESIETIEMVEIHADGGFTIDAGAGIIIEYEAHANLDEALTTISSQPGLEWMGDMRTNPTVDWNAVQATVEEWDYEQQGLTEAGALLVTAIVTYATGGAGGLVDTLATQVASGLNVAATNVAMNAAIKAGISNLVTQSSVALVNNQGDLAATLEQLGSKESLQGLVMTMVSAGITTSALSELGILDDLPRQAALSDRFARELQQNIVQATVDTTLDTVILGQEFDEALANNLRNAAASTIGQVGAEEIGNAAALGDLDRATQLIAHTALGCATGEIGSGDCSSGAIGAFAGELSALLYTDAALNNPELVGDSIADWESRGILIAELSGGLLAAAAGGSADVGAGTAVNAAENNAFWIPVILLATYLTYEGEGNPVDGLIAVGRGEDIASQLIGATAEQAVTLSSEYFPEGTAAVLNAAAAAGETAGLIVTYVDDTTGNRVSAAWDSLPADVQDGIKGATVVATIIIPAGAAGRIGRAMPDAPDRRALPDVPDSGLPEGFRPLQSAGAAGNSTGGLPSGFQRAIDPDGNVVVLDRNNRPYRAPGNLDDTADLDALVRGQDRATQFGGNWNSGSLDLAVRNVAGPNPTISYSNGKTIYTNPQTGNQVVYDRGGNYFRAIDPSRVNSNGGLRRDAYLTPDGSPVPQNRTVVRPDGTTRQVGMNQSDFNAATHYSNSGG